MLNAAQQEDYRRDGYLVMRQAFSADEVRDLRLAIDQLLETLDPERHQSVFSTTDADRGRDEVFFQSAESVEYFLEEGALDAEGKLQRPLNRAINKLGHALHDHVPAIGDFCRHEKIGTAYRQLGLHEPQLWQSMVIFKQPGIGGEVRWHQDASYLFTEPASVIGMWVALEDADRSNGCLMVAPGAHRSPLRERYRVDWERRAGALEQLDSTPWPAGAATRALEVEAGSVVFFSDHLPHGSAANRSGRSRTAFTLHAADGRAKWDTGNWLQRPSLPAFRL